MEKVTPEAILHPAVPFCGNRVSPSASDAFAPYADADEAKEALEAVGFRGTPKQVATALGLPSHAVGDVPLMRLGNAPATTCWLNRETRVSGTVTRFLVADAVSAIRDDEQAQDHLVELSAKTRDIDGSDKRTYVKAALRAVGSGAARHPQMLGAVASFEIRPEAGGAMATLHGPLTSHHDNILRVTTIEAVRGAYLLAHRAGLSHLVLDGEIRSIAEFAETDSYFRRHVR